MNVRELCERIVRHDPDVTRNHALVVSGDDGSLASNVTRGDVVRALNKTPELSVLEAGSRNEVAGSFALGCSAFMKSIRGKRYCYEEDSTAAPRSRKSIAPEPSGRTEVPESGTGGGAGPRARQRAPHRAGACPRRADPVGQTGCPPPYRSASRT